MFIFQSVLAISTLAATVAAVCCNERAPPNNCVKGCGLTCSITPVDASISLLSTPGTNLHLFGKTGACSASALDLCKSKCNCNAASICESQGWAYYANDATGAFHTPETPPRKGSSGSKPGQTPFVVKPCCNNRESPKNCVTRCGLTCEALPQTQGVVSSMNTYILVAAPGKCSASVLSLCKPKCNCDPNILCAAD